ncbi:MAG: hypothetical protein HN742_11425 [Lentisphaerae bacterium]|jgi:ankyrin repeat protein|nr:hypothetical protein [Lentisphaerota bacterium]MBT5613196.1 hypothetical protein [Lentisphaerota bacterium]MBT7059990.1 hypothetical protein [Lentisphaerota bacterium]MBT7842477.1 hypothetical protein [Lentisphaerota bacterium]
MRLRYTNWTMIAGVAAVGICACFLRAPGQQKGTTRVNMDARSARPDPKLIVAARDGDVDRVRTLLVGGADINAPDGAGQTALMVAAAHGHVEVATLLIEKGGDVKKADASGKTALMLACEDGKAKTAELLISKGANVNAATPSGYTPLFYATIANSAEMVKLLLRSGAEVNRADARGKTALSVAVVTLRVKAATALIEGGADPQIKDQAGLSPIRYARLKRQPEIRSLFGLEDAKASAASREIAKGTFSKEAVALFAANLNAFRLNAARDVEDAVSRWGTSDFQEKWQSEVVTPLANSPWQETFRDFFASAVTFVGGVNGDGATGAFYSPWQDGVLLIGASRHGRGAQVTDFQFVAGESWREETVRTGDDLLKLYALKEPLLLAVARNYSKTVELFNVLYPLQGESRLIARGLAGRVGTNSEELRPIVARMLYRIRMFAALRTTDNTAALTAIRELAVLVRDGDEDRLRAFLAPDQNAKMLRSICMLPATIRSNVGPVFFGQDSSAYVVSLVNPAHPKWVFAAQIKKGSDQGRTTRIETFDLDQSSQVIALREGRYAFTGQTRVPMTHPRYP